VRFILAPDVQIDSRLVGPWAYSDAPYEPHLTHHADLIPVAQRMVRDRLNLVRLD